MDGKPDTFWYVILYVLPIIGAIAVSVLYGSSDDRMKFHKVQSSIVGIVLIVLFIIGRILDILLIPTAPNFTYSTAFSEIAIVNLILGLISLLLWLYGIFVGIRAMDGKDMEMVIIGKYAKN